MKKAVELKIVGKEPPAGRCRIYLDMGVVLLEHYKNLTLTFVPASLRREGDPPPPAIVVNGREVQPADTVIVSAREITDAIAAAGAELYPGKETPLAALDAAVERHLA